MSLDDAEEKLSAMEVDPFAAAVAGRPSMPLVQSPGEAAPFTLCPAEVFPPGTVMCENTCDASRQRIMRTVTSRPSLQCRPFRPRRCPLRSSPLLKGSEDTVPPRPDHVVTEACTRA